MNSPQGVFLFFIILLSLIYFVLERQDMTDKQLIKEGRMGEGEIIFSDGGTRGHIKYLYFDEIKDSCVVGKRHTHYSNSTRPLVGERYKVFYDSKMSVLSVDDYLVKFRDSVLMINGDFYKIDSDTIQIDSFLPEICPD